MIQWMGFDLKKESLQGFDGEPIPFIFAQPQKGKDQTPCVLLLHGITASKEEQWFEPNGVTKGERLTLALLKKGYAVAAIDARMHGDRKRIESHSSEEDFTYILNNMDSIYPMTIKDIVSALNHLKNRKGVDSRKLAIMGYSMGALLSLEIGARHSEHVEAVIAAAPPVGVNDENEYHSEQLKKIQLPFLHLARSEDKWITAEDSRKAFETVPSQKKKFTLYESNHALPEEYIEDVLEWLGDFLG